MELICLLFPACIAASIRCKRKLGENRINSPEFILGWTRWVLVINIFTMVIISVVLGVEGVVEDAFKSFPFFIKYSLLAIGLSFVLPYVVEILEKYMEVSVEIGEQNEKDC